MDPVNFLAAEQKFKKIERRHLVCWSSSSWFSLLHHVIKEDVTWRPCRYYGQLNLATNLHCKKRTNKKFLKVSQRQPKKYAVVTKQLNLPDKVIIMK